MLYLTNPTQRASLESQECHALGTLFTATWALQALQSLPAGTTFFLHESPPSSMSTLPVSWSLPAPQAQPQTASRSFVTTASNALGHLHATQLSPPQAQKGASPGQHNDEPLA